MANLQESAGMAKQALRAVDGGENGAQGEYTSVRLRTKTIRSTWRGTHSKLETRLLGQDFNQWLMATWTPCFSLMGIPPPITWWVPDPSIPKRARSHLRCKVSYVAPVNLRF